jgi:hypothetical protein
MGLLRLWRSSSASIVQILKEVVWANPAILVLIWKAMGLMQAGQCIVNFIVNCQDLNIA